MNEAGSEIFRSTISAIWIALGSIILVCGVGCLIAAAVGNTEILWGGVGCAGGGPVLIGAGAAWYYLFKPRSA